MVTDCTVQGCYRNIINVPSSKAEEITDLLLVWHKKHHYTHQVPALTGGGCMKSPSPVCNSRCWGMKGDTWRKPQLQHRWRLVKLNKSIYGWWVKLVREEAHTGICPPSFSHTQFQSSYSSEKYTVALFVLATESVQSTYSSSTAITMC
jgi:hypothetical protein